MQVGREAGGLDDMEQVAALQCASIWVICCCCGVWSFAVVELVVLVT